MSTTLMCGLGYVYYEEMERIGYFSKGNNTKRYILDPFPEKILKQKWRKISNPFLYRKAKKVFAEQQRIRKFFTEKRYDGLKDGEWQDLWNSRPESIAEWTRVYLDDII